MRRLTPLLVAASVAAAACSSDEPAASVTDPPTTTTVPDATSGPTDTRPRDDTPPPPTVPTDELPDFVPEPIDWDELRDQVDVGTLDVPVDYADPDGDRFELYVARHRAIDPDARIGTLLVNPGGPGFGGSDFAVFAADIFDRALLERFDIVAWDPRGTGRSEPAIDCIADDEFDRFFSEVDTTPDDDEERAAVVDLAREFADACVANNAAIWGHVGTNSSARDVDALRRALGEDTVSYFGFSYGSELGAVWATLFPDTVRAAVLDGAADPSADPLESSLQQTAGFAASLDRFLARCSSDEQCAFHNDGDAEAAFDRLMVSLDEEPLPSDDGRPPVNRDVALTGVTEAMYSDASWPALEISLAAAQDGDGSGLLRLSDEYHRRRPDGSYSGGLEAFQVISCADRDERRTVEQIDAETARFTAVAPRLVPEGSIGGYFCTFFPPAADPIVSVDTAGAGPIVVIGTTGDPATPFEATVAMAELLDDGRLVIVEADQHTGYGVNRCIVEVVNDYLVDLDAPDSGTECR